LTPLKELLTERRISLRDLAGVAGTTETTCSRWRNRVTPPEEQYRAKIIKAYKLTDEELRKLGWPEGEKEPAGV